MTENEARTILGTEAGATRPETIAAYKRLMQTVHPDVCTGPEADRLARLATEAKTTLTSRAGETAGEPGGSTGGGKVTVDDETAYRVVSEVLEENDEELHFAEVFCAVRERLWAASGSQAERDAWHERLVDSDFWRRGAARGLWTIHEHAARITLTRRKTAGRPPTTNQRRRRARRRSGAGTQAGEGRAASAARWYNAATAGAITTAGLTATIAAGEKKAGNDAAALAGAMIAFGILAVWAATPATSPGRTRTYAIWVASMSAATAVGAGAMIALRALI